jgi:hypothetical protein
MKFRFYDLDIGEYSEIDSRDIVRITLAKNTALGSYIFIENMDGLFFATRELIATEEGASCLKSPTSS